MLTVFDDMIADTLNKKLNPIVTEIFIRGRKLNFLVFITKSYFPSNQRRVIEPAKFTYSLLGKTLEKQTKKNESQGGKNLKTMEKN